MAILQTIGLRKVYGRGETAVRALDGVDLTVQAGEFLSIVGTSGSGKSTLLHMLGGLDRPTAGQVRVDGTELFALREEALTIFRRRKIGFVFQSYNLVPVLSVQENILLPLQLDGRRPDKEYLSRVIGHLQRNGWLHNCYKTEELESVERGIISHSEMTYQNIRVNRDDCPSLDFDDLDTDAWYHEYVDYAMENGLMNGTGTYIFSPYSTLTRVQVITVLWRQENEPKADHEINFNDVTEGQWFTEPVRWAVSEEIMEGYGGAFGPNDPITWEQLAAILYRYALYKGYDVSVKGDPASFTDGSEISGWAYELMQWASGAGIFDGVGSGPIKPTGNTMRCEFASAITMFIEEVAK